MNDASGQLSVKGQEHWTNKGPAKLFMWEKRAPGGPKKGTILFVHGSSMASQPTFDLQVPGRPGAMDYFVGQGFDTWSVDMEGYGRSTKDRGLDATLELLGGPSPGLGASAKVRARVLRPAEVRMDHGRAMQCDSYLTSAGFERASPKTSARGFRPITTTPVEREARLLRFQ